MAAPAPNEIEVSLFGPGYGECVVVHLRNGDWMIIDSCLDDSRTPVCLSYLKSLGVDIATGVKLIVSTHWHDDHIRGLSRVVKEAPSARIVVSAAVKEEQFLTLIEVLRGAANLTDSGIREWTDIMETLAARKAAGGQYQPPIMAVGERRIFQQIGSAGTGACEVWSLSPSDEDVAHARAGFEQFAPKTGVPPSRLEPMRPNHTSVVVWVQLEDAQVLLGADLEQVSSPHGGWTAVVSSSTRPKGTAQIFKVPHHGSQNGHNADVWSQMLNPKPFSLISPFVHGKTVLPTTQDISRIAALSQASYVTIDPSVAKSRRKKSQSVANRTLLTQAKNLRPVPFGTGHIRLRKSGSGGWQVETFGTAKML